VGRGILVVAHRTCPGDAPENSISGIGVAARLGADVVEVDVRLTRDGVAVLHHDPVLRRTTEGRFPRPVRALTAAEVTAHRFRDDPTAGPPTFAQALDALPSGLRMAVDIKVDAAVPAVVAEVRRRAAEDRVLLWSRSPAMVRHCAEALPEVPRALLRNTHVGPAHRRYLDDAVACGASAVSLHEDAARPDVVAGARHRGLTVFAWFRSLEAQHRGRSLALDGVVTDHPEEARLLFGPSPAAG
jgi:glycerophosphoryl diester phosphodiesterase